MFIERMVIKEVSAQPRSRGERTKGRKSQHSYKHFASNEAMNSAHSRTHTITREKAGLANHLNRCGLTTRARLPDGGVG